MRVKTLSVGNYEEEMSLYQQKVEYGMQFLGRFLIDLLFARDTRPVMKTPERKARDYIRS